MISVCSFVWSIEVIKKPKQIGSFDIERPETSDKERQHLTGQRVSDSQESNQRRRDLVPSRSKTIRCSYRPCLPSSAPLFLLFFSFALVAGRAFSGVPLAPPSQPFAFVRHHRRSFLPCRPLTFSALLATRALHHRDTDYRSSSCRETCQRHSSRRRHIPV